MTESDSNVYVVFKVETPSWLVMSGQAEYLFIETDRATAACDMDGIIKRGLDMGADGSFYEGLGKYSKRSVVEKNAVFTVAQSATLIRSASTVATAQPRTKVALPA